MASITRKANGSYLVRVYCGKDGCGKSITRSAIFEPSHPGLSAKMFKRQLNQFAEMFEKKTKEAFNAGVLKDAPKHERILFADFCQKYLKIKKNILSPTTYPFYVRIIKEQLIPMFGKMYLDMFRVHHVQKFIQHVSDMERHDRLKGVCKLAPTTVKRYVTVLRSILALAYKMEYMDNDISMSRRLQFPKAQTKEVEVFTPEEVHSILEALMEEPIEIRTLIEVALFTGACRGEIVGLKWDDIDLEEKRLSIKRSIYKPKDGMAQEKASKI